MGDAISKTLIYIGFLLFIAWIFYMSKSPWAFVLLMFMPTFKTVKTNEKDENSKDIKYKE